MATNYNIRLKRFNGTDYDTLNLLSENIIMNTGDSLQNDIVPNTNGMLKNDNGVFKVATLGTDYTSINDSLLTSTTKTYSVDKIKSYGAIYFTSVPCSIASGDFVTLNDNAITSDHLVLNCSFDDSSAIDSNITWTTTNGRLVLNGNCVKATTANIILIKKVN